MGNFGCNFVNSLENFAFDSNLMIYLAIGKKKK